MLHMRLLTDALGARVINSVIEAVMTALQADCQHEILHAALFLTVQKVFGHLWKIFLNLN